MAASLRNKMSGTLERIDLRKKLKTVYGASRAPTVVDVPPLKVLAVDGQGDPNTSPDYAAAITALYSVSYTLKFTFKRGPDKIDYAVMPLEALWWADDFESFRNGDKSKWYWRAMIVQPDFVAQAQVDAAIVAVQNKSPNDSLAKLRFETFTEGRAAQLLHVGPYDAEGPNIERLHAFIAEQGGRLTGRHHEIYLSDPRRAAPDKLKTIIRQPFAPRTS
jgi:hypothetical protein